MHWLAQWHVRHPRSVALLVAAITLWALRGVAWVQFEDDPRLMYRVQDAEFAALEQFYDEFGPDDQDIGLLIQGDIFAVESVVALRAAYQAIQQIPEVETVISLFDIRKRGPFPLSLMPLEDAADLTSERVERARTQALAHPAVLGHFLSADAKTTLLSVRFRGGDQKISELEPRVRSVRAIAEAHLRPVGLKLRIAGSPPIRVDLLATMRKEVLKFTVFSALVSAAIALVIFRAPAAVAISVAGPLMGVIWTMGAMGWLGIKIDPLSVVMPTLLFVVGFTDSVHLVSDMQGARDRGASRQTAAAGAVAHLGPACFLTALTTTLGFGSLAVARLDVIQRFGLTCAAGTLVMLVAVQLVVPALSLTRLGEGLVSQVALDGVQFSTRLFEPCYRRMLLWPRMVATTSVMFTAACFLLSLRLQSDQRWTESLPLTSETTQVTADCDEIFGGSLFAYIVVEWPEELAFRSPEVLRMLADVHDATAGIEPLRGPLSVLNFLEGTRRPGDELTDQVRYLLRAPASLLQRFLREDLRKTAVTIHVPDVGARRLAPAFALLDQRLAKLQREHPGFKLQLTGTGVVSARNVYQMIRDLAWSLTIASGLIFLVITVLFRSLSFGLLSIVPNVMPQAITASLLVLANQPLTMTSVMTFSICLGLSVDDTVHFLMRFREERRRGRTTRSAVLRTFRAVGGVMITTSLVLIGGFLAMLGSQMPAVRTFATLCCVTLAAAILGDLIMLPSLMVWFYSRSRERRGSQGRMSANHSVTKRSAAETVESAER